MPLAILIYKVAGFCCLVTYKVAKIYTFDQHKVSINQTEKSGINFSDHFALQGGLVDETHLVSRYALLKQSNLISCSPSFVSKKKKK